MVEREILSHIAEKIGIPHLAGDKYLILDYDNYNYVHILIKDGKITIRYCNQGDNPETAVFDLADPECFEKAVEKAKEFFARFGKPETWTI
jgi:hypothetical protein